MNNPGVMVGYNSRMDEKYRLVFRGEVQDGQHRAVVKRRLMESLKLEAAQAEKLFSGKTVVLKRETDTKTAARYQALFNNAGARLRLLPVEAEDPARAQSAAHAGASPVADAPDVTDSAPTKAAAKTLAARLADESAAPSAGNPFNAAPERSADSASAAPAADAASSGAASAEEQPAGVSAADAILAQSNLSLQDNAELDRLVAEATGVVTEIEAPDYDIAELGALLADAVDAVIAEIPDVDLTLADVGADILTERVVVEPQISVESIDFDVAEVGADIGPPPTATAPPAPDTSHLQLEQA